jgi:hypothetical protein
MTKDETKFTQHNSQHAMEAASLGMNWAREFAEQSLDQGEVMLDALFKVTRKLTEGLDDQASAIREHSSSIAEKTLSNAIDFGHKLARLREPQEFMELQSEFVARQAQTLAEQSKELGQKIKSGTEKLANITARTTVRPSQAA